MSRDESRNACITPLIDDKGEYPGRTVNSAVACAQPTDLALAASPECKNQLEAPSAASIPARSVGSRAWGHFAHKQVNQNAQALCRRRWAMARVKARPESALPKGNGRPETLPPPTLGLNSNTGDGSCRAGQTGRPRVGSGHPAALWATTVVPLVLFVGATEVAPPWRRARRARKATKTRAEPSEDMCTSGAIPEPQGAVAPGLQWGSGLHEKSPCCSPPPGTVLRASDVAHRRGRGTRELVATETNCDARASGRD